MHRRLRSRLFAVLAAGISSLLALGLAAPALAETVGGEQLASTHRTVSLLPGADSLPDVWAETWIIADATTGAVLAQKGSHVKRSPASTLKMLTALTVLPRTSPENTFVATERAAGIYGARVGLKPGRAYLLDDLWYAVFLPSANDAAMAVAQANGGVRKTVRQMNRVARELQANDTAARNPSGLDSPGQVSSAYDLALIARAGLARQDFAKYARTKKATFPDLKGKGRHAIYTTNRLLLSGYRGAVGVKTGFTSSAGRTFVGAARRGGTTLIVALMGIHESSESAARKLLDWGFANHTKVDPIGVLVRPIQDPPAAAPDTASVTSPQTEADSPSVIAAPAQGSSALAASTTILWGAVLLTVVAGAVVGLRSMRRSRGRHAA